MQWILVASVILALVSLVWLLTAAFQGRVWEIIEAFVLYVVTTAAVVYQYLGWSNPAAEAYAWALLVLLLVIVLSILILLGSAASNSHEDGARQAGGRG